MLFVLMVVHFQITIYSTHKGALWLEIETLGKTAHGATPKEGINTIRKYDEYFKEVRKC